MIFYLPKRGEYPGSFETIFIEKVDEDLVHKRTVKTKFEEKLTFPVFPLHPSFVLAHQCTVLMFYFMTFQKLHLNNIFQPIRWRLV